MSGAGAVAALVLLEWTAGSIGAAAWTQSWAVVRRGHFRIVAWAAILLGVLALASTRAATSGVGGPVAPWLAVAPAAAAVAYLVAQYARSDRPGAVVGAIGAVAVAGALVGSAALLDAWPAALAAAELIAGALLLGAVTNGMLLGHWYLNQPGLKPWALARLTDLSLAAVAGTLVLGVAAAGRLARASTEGAILGLPGFGASFGLFFFVAWIALITFTGAVVWGARRCVKLRSIQSATGLFYVALLTAGVSEFVVRYLMVNA